MIHITKGMIPFWDDHLIDPEFTDAILSVNRPEKAGIVMEFDRPWESDGTDFFTIIKSPICPPHTTFRIPRSWTSFNSSLKRFTTIRFTLYASFNNRCTFPINTLKILFRNIKIKFTVPLHSVQNTLRRCLSGY